jgi:hypothetical protein
MSCEGVFWIIKGNWIKVNILWICNYFYNLGHNDL